MNKKIVAVFLTLIIMVVSLLVIYKMMYQLYDKYNDTRLDPLKSSTLNIDSTKMYNWILLGDSHCQYWSLNKENVLNLGITGQTSSQIKIRSLILGDKLKGQNLILAIGANDIKSIATNPENSNSIVDNCIDNIQQILTSRKGNFANIYVLTVPPDFNVGIQQRLFNYKETFDAKINLNNKIRELAKSNNIKLIDAYKIFEDKNNLSEDGVHMNSDAYNILNSYLK